jgi:ribosomal-protein-alanine N-acetyltransferase
MIRTDFGEFPLLETERVFLRPLCRDDEAAIFRLRSDEAINQWLGRKSAESIEDARNFIDRIVRLVDGKEAMYWALETRQEGRFAGTVTLWNLDQSSSKAEIGYELLPEFHGKGIMLEVVRTVLDFGFEKMNLKKIEACLSPGNLKSLSLLQKLKFDYEGPLESEPDLVVYALVKPGHHM